jgi:hypothetical protein
MRPRDMLFWILAIAALLLIVANFITWQHNAAYTPTPLPTDPNLFLQLPTK